GRVRCVHFHGAGSRRRQFGEHRSTTIHNLCFFLQRDWFLQSALRRAEYGVPKSAISGLPVTDFEQRKCDLLPPVRLLPSARVESVLQRPDQRNAERYGTV